MLDLLEEPLELLVKKQIELGVKIQENINTVLEYMNKHFSKNEERRSAPSLENDTMNLAIFPQLEIVKFTWELIAFSRIHLFKVIVDSSLKLTIVEKFNHQQSYLDKEALQAISEVVLTNNNYLKADDSLN